MSPFIVAQRKRDQQLPALEAETVSRPHHLRCLEPPRDTETCRFWQYGSRISETVQ
jgi:hypothetical protein